MDCSDLNKYLDNEMNHKEKQLFAEHIKACEKCSSQIKFYTCLKTDFIPELPDNFEKKVMTEIHCCHRFEGFVIFALFSLICGIVGTISANYFTLVHTLQYRNYPQFIVEAVHKLNFSINHFVYLWENLTDSISHIFSDILPVGVFFIFVAFMLYNLSLKERL